MQCGSKKAVLEPQSRFGDKLLGIRGVGPPKRDSGH